MAQAVLGTVATLAGGGLVLLLVSRWIPPRWLAWAALGLGIAALLPLVLLRSGPSEVTVFRWIPAEDWSIVVAYRFDTLAVVGAALAGLPAFLLLLWVAIGAPAEEGAWAPWVLLSLALCLHLFGSADLLLAYVGWEVLLLATYCLLTYRRATLPTPGIAEWFLGIQHLAGYLLLFGLLWTAYSARTLLYTRLGPGTVGPLVLLLLLISAWVRTAQVPFHGWAMATAEAPGPVSTLVLGGWTLLAGPYLWLRLLSLMAEHAPREVALVAGSVSLVVGAVLALRQESGRRVQAGDTVSRMGLVWMALGLDSLLGMAAGLFLLLDLLLSKVLFHLALAGGSRLERHVRQGLLALGMGGALGVPPSLGFVGRWLLVLGIIQAGQLLYLPVVLLSIPLAVAYLWRAWNLVPRLSSTAVPARSTAQRVVVAMAALLPLGGLAAPWLWQGLFEPGAGAVFGGMAAVELRPLLEALQGWMPAWAAILLLLAGAGAWWSGALRRRTMAAPAGEEGPLQEPLPTFPQETAWLAWIGQPAPLYRFFGQIAILLGAALRRLVTFMERHTTYFLLVVLLAATVMIIILTR